MAQIIITDSTSDLPLDFVEENKIHIVPLNIHLQDSLYKDGVDIQPSELYYRLRTEDIFPQTSQPSAGEFMEIYQTLKPDDEVLVLCLSSELSGTYQSAEMARDMVAEQIDAEIHVVDSRSVSLGLGMQVIHAQKCFAEGKDMAQTLYELAEIRRRMRLIFAVDTLEYLARGGRISQLSKRLGNLLQLKPVLHLEEGRIEVLDKVRTRSKAVQRMLEIFYKEASQAQQVGILHIDAPTEGQQLAQKVQEYYHGPLLLAQCGAVIGSHAGPGTVGICWY
ncbi:MAG: DegV family protein [Syntrophomonadaceae bacterium]|nr:DegV family protein [Syntrophomonadaceae bacterium]